MSDRYICPECSDDITIPPEGQTEVVYVNNNNGVAPTIICPTHNEPLEWVESVSTEWSKEKEDFVIDHE